MIDMFYYIQVGVRIEYRGSIGNVVTRTLLRKFSDLKFGIYHVCSCTRHKHTRHNTLAGLESTRPQNMHHSDMHYMHTPTIYLHSMYVCITTVIIPMKVSIGRTNPMYH